MTALTRVRTFLRRCGSRTEAAIGRASACPIRDEQQAKLIAMVRLRKMRRSKEWRRGVCISGAKGLEYPPALGAPFPAPPAAGRRRGEGRRDAQIPLGDIRRPPEPGGRRVRGGAADPGPGDPCGGVPGLTPAPSSARSDSNRAAGSASGPKARPGPRAARGVSPSGPREGRGRRGRHERSGPAGSLRPVRGRPEELRRRDPRRQEPRPRNRPGRVPHHAGPPPVRGRPPAS